MVDTADMDADGKISEKEFMNVMKRMKLL